CVLRHRQSRVAARRAQHEVRLGVPLLHRGFEPFFNRRVAADQFQHDVDARAARQFDRSAFRTGFCVVPARPAHRRHDEVRGGLLYPDTGGPNKAWERNLANIMPRAGFAWLATPQTSVRGGYGIFYDVLGTNRITVNQVGYSRDTTLTPSLDNGQTFVATLANPFPTGPLEPAGSGLGL